MSEAAAAGAPPADPPAAPAKGKETEYVVLFKSEDAASGSAWFVGRTVKARTPQKAIEKHMEAEVAESGEFVAVPKRHWKIEKPQTQTTSRLVF